MIRSNPAKMRILLVRNNPVRLNANIMLDLFVPPFSLEGSNQRESEEAVLILWANFIQLVESELLLLVYNCLLEFYLLR